MILKAIFQNRYVALETPSRPPPFMANTILNFHFDYLTPSLTPLLANHVLFSALSIIGMCLKYTQYRNYSGVFWGMAVLSPRQWAGVAGRVYVIHRPTLLFLSYRYKCTGCTTFADNEPWCFSAPWKTTHWAQRHSEMPREPISGESIPPFIHLYTVQTVFCTEAPWSCYACVQFFRNNFNRGILKSVVRYTRCFHFNNDFLG